MDPAAAKSRTGNRQPMGAPSRLAKRLGDVLLAAALLLLTAPVWTVPLLRACGGRRPFFAKRRLGRRGCVFLERRIAVSRALPGRSLRRLRLDRIPLLLNILLGDTSFVGPRRRSPREEDGNDAAARRLLAVRPGLVCHGWLRRRAHMAYGREIDADLQYAQRPRLLTDIGILLRCVPALLLGGPTRSRSARVELFGVPIDNLTMADSIEAILQRLEGDRPSRISFVNADCINLAARRRDYRAALCTSSLVFSDGVGMRLAGKILGKSIRENVNGTDLFPRLCRRLEGRGTRVFLLGARPGVADRVVGWIESHYPGVCVCGTQHGFYAEEDEAQVVGAIRRSRADLLLVAFGAPRQELWIRRRLPQTGVKVAMGVGGLFDFYAGDIPRAPVWVREVGMEWAYRVYQEPLRLGKRYLIGNGLFLLRALAQRVRETSPLRAVRRLGPPGASARLGATMPADSTDPK